MAQKSQRQLETTIKSAGVEISGLHTRCQTYTKIFATLLALACAEYEAVGDKDAVLAVYSRLV